MRPAGAVTGLALVVALACAAAFAQVSPGPLSRAHRDLEGNRHCFECHGSGAEKGIDRGCLACHREVAATIAARRGLHGRGATHDCATCHPEHGGADFALVAFEEGAPAKFDHARAGWPLDGKHARLDCDACHANAAFRVAPAATLAPKPGTKWIGLDPSCASCHRDAHRGTLGADCRGCHGTASWAVPRFDHARTAFPLAGRHAAVACAKCHPAPRVMTVRPPVPHAECSACHHDPHDARLGASCSRCHDPSGWRTIAAAGTFDHAKTAFPLAGRHRDVACAKCHEPQPGRHVARPAFDRCAACHADAHGSQLRSAQGGRPPDCGTCHDANGWRPSTFPVARHASTDYPLAGKHAAVACAKCHARADDPAAAALLGSARIPLHPRHASCRDCHADPHGTQLAAVGLANAACERCHDAAGYAPARFTRADHAALRFALDGKHADAACAACHKVTDGKGPRVDASVELGSAKVLLSAPLACSACHTDPHHGRFEAGGERPAERGCLTCHSTTSFRPSTVDDRLHARFGMRLDGAHAAVPCSGCHAEARAREFGVLAASAPLSFRDARRACADCHADPHAGQFARAANGCATCHAVDAFRPARFDHDRTRFPLGAAHARVACARCHRAGAAGSVVRYVGTPASCQACHGPGERP